MTETRIKISSIVENQLPLFVRDEFPLVSEFLSQYYISLENQGGTSDILQNIDQYIKIDNLTNLTESTELVSDITFFDSTINVTSTAGFPDTYGLLLIGSEIITYTSKTTTTFEGCIRGFSGVTSYKSNDELTFKESETQVHTAGNVVANLSILFLKQFLIKVKTQVTPGFENRELYSELNERLFIKQSIDFYSSKGTDNSFKILFGALYGKNVEIIRPRDYLIKPSDAQYRITSNFVVESIEGNAEDLVNRTLYQDETDFLNKAQGTITKVEKIRRGENDYYVVSLDFDYNKDILPQGTIYGEFSIHPKTNTVIQSLIESETLEVDSTVGFPTKNGKLIVELENGTSLNITYESKTLNQFLGCSGITQDIPENSELKLDSYAYGIVNGEQVKVRILGVLSKLEIPEGTRFYSKDDTIKIKTLGIDLNDYKSNNWFFNIPVTYQAKSIQLLDNSDFSYRIEVYDTHNLKVGDLVTLTSDIGKENIANVISYESEKTFAVQLGTNQLQLNTNLSYTVKKNLSKVLSENYPSLNQFTSNVQNVYFDDEKSLYVTSPSLPTYFNQSLKINDQSITFSGTFEGETLNIGRHGFYTGDSIVYKPSENNNLGIPLGIYFIKKISETEVKLARSKSNIFTKNFVFVSGTVVDAKFELTNFTFSDLSTQNLESQKLIRKISDPETDDQIHETEPGLIGIFVNGVELLNYKSKDNVFYGPIEKIIPTAGGTDYDVINPPILSVIDPIGSGANGYCSVKGELKRIDIIDPGFDYLEEPKIEITGGNGSDASAKVRLISFDHEVSFNSQSSAGLVKLNPINSVGFTSYHKFRDAEEVVYVTNSQNAIGGATTIPLSGLSTNSSYFVSVQDEFTVKFHKSFSDAVSGINTIQLISYGTGNHSFKCKNKKKKIGSITIENSGSNYQNNLTIATASGINTASNIISIKSHGYQSGEIIVYNTTQTSIGGLSSATSYYVTKINDDEFKLSSIGIGSLGITTSFYYNTKQYINLTSKGSGSHQFNYTDIKVNVKGRIGVSTLTGQDFNAVIQPVFRGEIQSIFVESGGSGYGSQDIINFNRQPVFELNSGSGIQLKPIISNGQIVAVLVNSPGGGYNSSPNLEVIGDGVGAILTPVLLDGSLVEVKVIYGGIGYNENNTAIIVTPAGLGAKFESSIKSWKINLVERFVQNSKISDDDGLLTSGLNVDYGLQYSHAYAPRQLRSLVQGTSFRRGKTVYSSDLSIQDKKEVTSNAHSPIIGWAYDGNPIYGPYGFSSKNGGSVKCLISGYEQKLLSGRPSTSIYPQGFFVEDYEYVGNGDLDEYNGRFGITPEFPNGVYAYFTTINSGEPEKTGLFENYKKPIFPYVIGQAYKSRPINFNFQNDSNQDSIDINETGWKRNTTPYGLLSNQTSYNYLLNPNELKEQNSIIKTVSSGNLDFIDIIDGGKDYEAGDQLVFENKGKVTFSAKGIVSIVKGKTISQISIATSSFDNVVLYPNNFGFIGFTTVTHNYLSNDLVTFTGKFDYKKSGNVILDNNVLSLTSGIGSAQYTGLVTYFNVSGNLSYPSIRENDIYQIGNEIVKILNIDPQSSRIRVLRNQNGTTGLVTYTAGIGLTEKTKRFLINFGISTSYNFKVNKEFYFDPLESVGLGTTSGVGISSTLFLSINSLNNEVGIGTSIKTKLYFNKLLDLQFYNNGGYIDIVNASNSSFNISKKKIVGIGETSITIDFDTSSLSGVGVTAFINKWNIINIPTQTIYLPNHNLGTGDSLVYSANGGTRVSVSTDGVSNFQLSDNSIVYVAKISNDLIGISTIKVGLSSIGNFVGVGSTATGILYFTSVGTGDTHSFKTNYQNSLTGKISKNVVTVSTAETHGLSLLDVVTIDIKTGINAVFTVKYDDYNRRMLVNPRTFSSINTEDNIITISDHKYYVGQKVLYTSNNPATGLTNYGHYYVIVVDSDTIMLSSSYYGATKSYPEIVDISSSTTGTISPINPPINIEKNQPIIFDLSDSSLSFFSNDGFTTYSAFELRIYKNNQFTEEFDTTLSTNAFEVLRSGRVGIDSTAKLTILVNDKTPKNLYYKLVPINLNLIPETKKEIITDFDVISANNISIFKNKLNNIYSIVGISSTSFSYNILEKPNYDLLTSDFNTLEYYTSSPGIKGPIKEISLINKGRGYTSLPSVSSVISQSGSGAILIPVTSTIGKVTSVDIQDIGFDYSADYSIRPLVKYPTILVLEPLSAFDSIGISSFGKNYNIAPSLVVLDGLTNELVKDVNLSYLIGDKNVTINKNTSELNNVTPKIIPINNSNGIKIKNITFNDLTKDVTVTLGASFSNSQDYPFFVGGKVLIEGVSVGVGSTGKGYNSSEYNYSLFTLTAIDPNIGGSIGVVTYSLSSYLKDTEIPGSFNAINSAGKIIPDTYFPIFDIKLKKNTFYNGETVYTSTASGSVQNWDEDNQYLKVSTVNDFFTNQQIRGRTSGSVGIIEEIINFESDYKVNAFSLFRKGWNRETGFLNNSFQRIHDSDYYQYFSYDLRSQEDFNTWNNPVSALNHTAGFKKFGNLVIESISLNAGISTDQNRGDFTGICDLSSFVNLNCVYDFDLVSENNLNIGGSILSDQILFNSVIVQDYIESIGNRVLVIDDVSDSFNSNPRATAFSVVDSFNISDYRFKKYIILIKDKKNFDQMQLSLLSLIHDNNTGFLNQYGIDSVKELGFFDFSISETTGNLLFYPIKSKLNDYYTINLSFSINESLIGIGTTNLGNSAILNTSASNIPSGTTSSTTIVGIASTYRSSKVLVQIEAVDSSYYEYDEITYIHDGSNVFILDYGQLTSDTSATKSSSGIGTYNAYISGNNVLIDLIPNNTTTVGYSVNTFNISIASTASSGVGTQQIGGAIVNSSAISIASTDSPVSNIISSYLNDDLNLEYKSTYSIICVEDKTNLEYQVSEFLTITDKDNGECFTLEFGSLQTSSSLGITTAGISSSYTNIYFTPLENIDVDVKVFQVSMSLSDTSSELLFENGFINYNFGTYVGTDNDIKKQFDLTHKNIPIFKRYFDASNSDVANISANTIRIPNHFYVTGEEVVYSYPGPKTTQAIGIATTSIAGVGTTDKMPSSLYIVKINDLDVQVAASASDALKSIPNVLNLISVGIGSLHAFTSKNQNKKSIITIDNLIQSPVVSTSTTTICTKNISLFDSEIYVSNVNLIVGADLIKIDDEIMKVSAVGLASTNAISVIRPWMGTGISTHSSSSLVTKVLGNYNIVENSVHFVEAPFGKIPFVNQTSSSDEVDYIGISTGSSFSGRIFLRSGVSDTTNESYGNNYIFDDISDDFNGSQKSFTLKSSASNVTGISTDNAIVLINSIFQGPVGVGVSGDYDLVENAGITSITFTGSSQSTNYDVNTSSIPRGGIILSVGSTQGFGYQPLVSAGGTAIVSSAGTVQSISIGNSGSGYRSGIQETINVGVKTENLESSVIEFIGTAAVLNGNIVSVAITNPGVGYTSSNPPIVIFDSPLSYSNLPLIYSSDSVSGLGTGAVADIVVGQGSSVISFEIKNLGYGYNRGEILTVSIGGTTGIQTTSSIDFSEFQITIDGAQSDQFAAWTVGNLQVIDHVDSLFDGIRTVFPILIQGNQTTIRSKKGSIIDTQALQASLLVFINDILQVPGEGYVFTGGSAIRFTEPPKEGDKSKIIFYRGTGDVDTQNVDILENIKVGDKLTIESDQILLNQNERLVTEIISSDIVETNLYPGPGLNQNESLLRPIKWCRQTEDIFINGQSVGKDRVIYEPYIQPTTNIIENIGINTTIIYVESVKTFFDSEREYIHDGTNEKPQNKVSIISQDNLVSASATAVVSAAGTISSIKISDGGVGYSTSAIVSIQKPSSYLISTTGNIGINTNLITGINTSKISVGQEIFDPISIVSSGTTVSSIGIGTITISNSSLNTVLQDGVEFKIGITSIASAVSSISIGGTLSSISIVNSGTGYTTSNPPLVLIEPPKIIKEIVDNVSYDGDFGVVVGFGTTTILGSNYSIFDLYIPENSYLRDSSIVGSAITLSQLNIGDFFVINKSNIGFGTTQFSTYKNNNSVIGISTQFIDGIYQVFSTQIHKVFANTGMGNTYIKRVFTKSDLITGISSSVGLSTISVTFDSTPYTFDSTIFTFDSYDDRKMYGEFTWGKITIPNRKTPKEFNSYGFSGITTSASVIRFNKLRYEDYN